MASDAGTGPGHAPRKTLEDIRREIDAEYPPFTRDDRLGEPDAAEPLVPGLRTPPYLDEDGIALERPDEIAVEPHRLAPRGGAGRRGYVMVAAIGCIAGQVLLVVAYVAVTRYARDVIWPRAPASAPGLSADDTTALAATALAQPRREPSPAVLRPAPAPRVDLQLEALRTDLHSLAVKLERAESRVIRAESRVSGVESQVNGVESAMRGLGNDVASAAARPRPRVDPQLEALRTDLRSLAVKLERAESRVTRAESRVSGVESHVSGVASSMRRPGDDVASAAARPRPRVDPQLEALRTDLHSLAAKLERAESRVTRAESRVSGVESRVNGVESSMRRLGDGVASAAARPRQVEHALSAPRQIAAKPAPPAPLPPARAPVTATDSERRISSEHVAPPSPPPPHQVPRLAEAPAPSALSPPPQPRRESSRSLETEAPTTHSAPIRAARAPSDNASSSNTPPNLRDKLRDDWRTIRQGFASAGDDFKAAMRDFARRVRGE